MERDNWLEFKPEKFEYNGKWIKNWFSNMVPSPIFIGETLWPSVENYYQAMKTDDVDAQEIVRGISPNQSKRVGRNMDIRPDWEDVKEKFMKRALNSKFNHSPWFEALMATGDSMIIEWNNWNDLYWGADATTGRGKNRLGILLMEIRDEYKNLPNEDNKQEGISGNSGR